MRADEIDGIAEALGRPVADVQPLAGGFSHETCLLTLADRERVVVRLGGTDPGIEAAVMARAGAHAPVPPVLRVVPAVNDEARPAMVLEYVPGTLLSDVLATAEKDENDLAELGAEVGRVIAGIGTWSPARRDTPWPTRQPTRSAAGSPTAYRTHQRPRITRCTAMVPGCRSGPSG